MQYILPAGRKKVETIGEDTLPIEVIDFIVNNKIKVSYEEGLGGSLFTTYFDYGVTVNNDPDEDPDELIMFNDSLKQSIIDGVEHLKSLDMFKSSK